MIAAFFSLALTTLNPAQYVGGFERAYRNLCIAITEYEIGVVENDKQAKRALVAMWRQCNEDVIFRSQDKNGATRLDDEPEPARERRAQPG